MQHSPKIEEIRIPLRDSKVYDVCQYTSLRPLTSRIEENSYIALSYHQAVTCQAVSGKWSTASSSVLSTRLVKILYCRCQSMVLQVFPYINSSYSQRLTTVIFQPKDEIPSFLLSSNYLNLC